LSGKGGSSTLALLLADVGKVFLFHNNENKKEQGNPMKVKVIFATNIKADAFMPMTKNMKTRNAGTADMPPGSA
jgi:hypothetical protein